MDGKTDDDRCWPVELLLLLLLLSESCACAFAAGRSVERPSLHPSTYPSMHPSTYPSIHASTTHLRNLQAEPLPEQTVEVYVDAVAAVPVDEDVFAVPVFARNAIVVRSHPPIHPSIHRQLSPHADTKNGRTPSANINQTHSAAFLLLPLLYEYKHNNILLLLFFHPPSPSSAHIHIHS
eukprot:GHVU01128563.1.p1 GENE.GHVU01128563.1~~GHVU01128563.1.p1  ORF type:complete len:179 (-),score=17.58 GHVU01128563.1:221-757(-)